MSIKRDHGGGGDLAVGGLVVIMVVVIAVVMTAAAIVVEEYREGIFQIKCAYFKLRLHSHQLIGLIA